jgi:hypothetical protein
MNIPVVVHGDEEELHARAHAAEDGRDDRPLVAAEADDELQLLHELFAVQGAEGQHVLRGGRLPRLFDVEIGDVLAHLVFRDALGQFDELRLVAAADFVGEIGVGQVVKLDEGSLGEGDLAVGDRLSGVYVEAEQLDGFGSHWLIALSLVDTLKGRVNQISKNVKFCGRCSEFELFPYQGRFSPLNQKSPVSGRDKAKR